MDLKLGIKRTKVGFNFSQQRIGNRSKSPSIMIHKMKFVMQLESNSDYIYVLTHQIRNGISKSHSLMMHFQIQMHSIELSQITAQCS